MTKRIYRARPIVTISDIIFIITFSFLIIGSICGYLSDYFQRIR